MKITKPNLKNVEPNTPWVVAASVVVTVIVIVLTGTAIKSMVTKFGRNNSILGRKKEVREQLESNIDSLGQLETQFQSLGAGRNLILDALPTEPDFASLVSMMENLSRNSGVTMSSITSGKDLPADTGPSSFDFSVSISGNYTTLAAFLRNVEHSLRPLAVKVITISGSSSSLTAEVQLGTYYQKPFDTTLKTEPLFSDTPKIDVTQTSSTGAIPGAGVINSTTGAQP